MPPGLKTSPERSSLAWLVRHVREGEWLKLRNVSGYYAQEEREAGGDGEEWASAPKPAVEGFPISFIS